MAEATSTAALRVVLNMGRDKIDETMMLEVERARMAEADAESRLRTMTLNYFGVVTQMEAASEELDAGMETLRHQVIAPNVSHNAVHNALVDMQNAIDLLEKALN